VGVGLAAFFGLLLLQRRSQRLAIAAAVMAFASLTTFVTPAAPSPSPLAGSTLAGVKHLSAAQLSDVERFGKPISTVKPQIEANTLHPVKGPITPYRLRVPALEIDTMVEAVGVTRRGLMDVPGNIWDAAWLKSGVKPGASGQAVIDGHLDSTQGSAVFSDLHRLRPGDRVYVSDAAGGELTFRVTALQVAPLDGFPVVRVFGPKQGRFLNLITCAGSFDGARKTYDHRLVVFTELV
jgi:LPXTG-site transpeptidase (sortase) family protein